MTSTARRPSRPFVTIAEFDAFLEALDAKGEDAGLYDLLGGEIVMMTDPNRRHGIIVKNIAQRLATAMDRRRWETYSGDMRVQRSDDLTEGDKSKPDIVVRCGQTSIEDETRNDITDPIVLVEVLSRSTERVDIFQKVPFYMSLDPARHIVIVDRHERRIEHWHRADADADWSKLVLPRDGERLVLDAVAFEITLDEVYEGIASLARS